MILILVIEFYIIISKTPRHFGILGKDCDLKKKISSKIGFKMENTIICIFVFNVIRFINLLGRKVTKNIYIEVNCIFK